MLKSDIIKSFNPHLDKENKRIVEIYSDLEDRIEKQKGLFESFSLYLLEQHSILKNKLEETELKVNNALFGDKKFLSETLSLDIPLNQSFFNTDVNIIDGILTPKPKIRSLDDKVNIPLSYITSRRETDFKILNGKLYLDKNSLFPYQELEIRLPKDVDTGFLYVFFDRYEKISVLDKFGKEVQDTAISNQIITPINEKTNSIVVRFEDNKNKVLTIKNMYVAKNSFETTTTVETKNIVINQYLKEIGINTCDNYSDPSIDIKYYISINDNKFREIRPLNKQKNIETPSILSVDDKLHPITLSNSIETDLGVKYTLDHLDSSMFYIMKSFKGKLGVNKGFKLKDEVITIHNDKEISFVIHQGQEVVLNNKAIRATSDSFKVIIPSGFNTLQIDELLWNQKENLLKYTIQEVLEDKIILMDKESGSLLSKASSAPTSKTSLSVFLQLVGKADFYFDEYEAKVSYINEDKFIDKESPNDTFLFVKYKTKLVEVIKIKIEMNTKEPKVPAYLSSLTIRGV